MNFLRKTCFIKLSLIHSISHQNRNYYFRFWRWKAEVSLPKNLSVIVVCSIRRRSPNRTYCVRFTPSKPDLSGPKNSFESVISYQQDTNWTLKTAWPSAWDTRPWPPSGRAGKRRRKGGRNTMQRERHPKFEITLIRKTGTSSSDFALKFTSCF